MKFILREGINPPLDGKMMTHPRPISMFTLQASKSHSSKTTKSALISLAIPSAPESETHLHTTTTLHVTPELQQTSTPQVHFDPQTNRLGILFESLHKRIEGMATLLYSTNNQVQMRLKAMKNQLDAIHQKLKDGL